MRRRQGRLRSMLRHGQQSVAMALAQALHHSAGPREKVVERCERPEEGEVHETHNASRSQTTPLPGKRPAPLSEVTGPQVAVTSGYVAASVPLLGAPSLADSSAEVIDGSTLSFLLQRALEVKRKEEEEEAVEAAELVELEEKVAVAESKLLLELRRDREEGTRITPQTWSSLSRVEQLAVHWFIAKEKVGKKREKRKKKKKRRRMWKTRRSLLRCSS